MFLLLLGIVFMPLDAAHAATDTALILDPISRPDSGGAVTFSGILFTFSGDPIPDKMIIIKHKHPWFGWLGLFDRIASLETDSRGYFSGTVPALDVAGTRVFYAEFGGDSDYAGAEGTAGIEEITSRQELPVANASSPTLITLDRVKSAYVGHKVEFTGHLVADGKPLVAKNVEIREGNGFLILGSGNTGHSGKFLIEWTVQDEHLGTINVLAAYPGSAEYEESQTPSYEMTITHKRGSSQVWGSLDGIVKTAEDLRWVDPPSFEISGGEITDIDLYRGDFSANILKKVENSVLDVWISAPDDGMLTVTIPSSMYYFGGYFMVDFSVKINERKVDIVVETDEYSENRIFKVEFPAGTRNIEITAMIEDIADQYEIIFDPDDEYEQYVECEIGNELHEKIDAVLGPGEYLNYTVSCDTDVLAYSLIKGDVDDEFIVYAVVHTVDMKDSIKNGPNVVSCRDYDESLNKQSGKCGVSQGYRFVIENTLDRQITLTGTVDAPLVKGTVVSCQSDDLRYDHPINKRLEPGEYVYYTPLCSGSINYHITTAGKTGAFVTYMLPVKTDLDVFVEEGLGSFGPCELGEVWYDRSYTCKIDPGYALLVENAEDHPIILTGSIFN